MANSESSNYPKVLLFGHSFNDITGMGITLTNLFADWPKVQIAVMANHIDLDLCERIRPCTLYIGRSVSKVKAYNQDINKKTLTAKIKHIIRHQYHKAGVRELTYKPSISKESLRLAQTFNPDIVLCCLGSLSRISLCEYFMDRMPNAKLVLYIVDDWVNTKFNSRYFAAYWRRRYNREYRNLLNRASGNLSICQYMSDAYMEQYGKKFYPFHNPVNIKEWTALNVEPKYPVNVVSILYVGKINDDTRTCLIEMSKVVEDLDKDGYKFVLDIYTPDYNYNSYIFDGLAHCNVFPSIPHADIPRITKSYSALFLSLGFSKQSREYVRLSMPTKLSEYLASGIPIILYCPPEIALAKYLTNKDCAIVCTENKLDILKEKVSLLNDSRYCANVVLKSLKLTEVHETTIVRESFRKTMCSFISK